MGFIKHLELLGVSPRNIRLHGFLQPSNLVLHIGYESGLYDAVISWLQELVETGSKPDLEDPIDRIGMRACLLQQHEGAHYMSFITSPLARAYLGLHQKRFSCWFAIARLLHDSGIDKLHIPLSRWRENYSLGSALERKIIQIEEQGESAGALFNMLMMGPAKDPAPAALNGLSKTADIWWPWYQFYNSTYDKQKCGGICFRDIQEGLATNFEFISVAPFGIGIEEFSALRAEIPNRYWAVPRIIARVMQQYREVTLAIAMTIALSLPAIAIVTRQDQWQYFDASTCLGLVLGAIDKIGPFEPRARVRGQLVNELGSYIEGVFSQFLPGFAPSTLLVEKNQEYIHQALGLDDYAESGHLSANPGFGILLKVQGEMNTIYENEWPLRFLPFFVNIRRWHPPVVWLTDKIIQVCSHETYQGLRQSFLHTKLAQDIWYGRNLNEFFRWSFGGVVGTDGGQLSVASALLAPVTGFDVSDVYCQGRRLYESV